VEDSPCLSWWYCLNRSVQFNLIPIKIPPAFSVQMETHSKCPVRRELGIQIRGKALARQAQALCLLPLHTQWTWEDTEVSVALPKDNTQVWEVFHLKTKSCKKEGWQSGSHCRAPAKQAWGPTKNPKQGQVPVAHAYNPSYSVGRDLGGLWFEASPGK
jgi:hypothetical protein